MGHLAGQDKIFISNENLILMVKGQSAEASPTQAVLIHLYFALFPAYTLSRSVTCCESVVTVINASCYFFVHMTR